MLVQTSRVRPRGFIASIQYNLEKSFMKMGSRERPHVLSYGTRGGSHLWAWLWELGGASGYTDNVRVIPTTEYRCLGCGSLGSPLAVRII